jgi:hypothetical protein
MKMKVEKLRLTRSDDPIQQLQSDISGDFYDAIRDLQVMADPLISSFARRLAPISVAAP